MNREQAWQIIDRARRSIAAPGAVSAPTIGECVLAAEVLGLGLSDAICGSEHAEDHPVSDRAGARHPQPWCQACQMGTCRTGEHFMSASVAADLTRPEVGDELGHVPLISVGATWDERGPHRYSIPAVYVTASSSGDMYLSLEAAGALSDALEDAMSCVRYVLAADHHTVCDCGETT
ncbi:hypothetical protein ACPXB3_00500 [Gordonia sp. DT219]|uniref:hypothetical protein n=1 Tax=Gordonia sp. DT219 TaxID=3416658 RepID=UPI003CE73573